MKSIQLHTIVNYTDRLHNHGYSAVADGSITADQINHDVQYGLNLTVSVDELTINALRIRHSRANKTKEQPT